MYSIYYPEEGRYSQPMTLKEARSLAKQFLWASIVNINTGEVIS